MTAHASLPRLLRERAAAEGGLPALWSRRGRDRFGALTWAGALALAQRGAAALRAAGLRAGDVVALEGRPDLSRWALALGAMASGVLPALVFGDWPEETLRGALARCRARALATSGPLAARAAGWGPGALERVIALDSPRPGGGRTESFDALAARAAPEPLADPDPSAVALIAFTAGTTGDPKPVALRHQALAFSAAQTARAVGLSAQDVLLSLEPLASPGELLVSLGLPLASGAQLFLGAGSDAAALLEEVRPTFVWAGAAVWEDLARRAGGHPGGEGGLSERLSGWARREAGRRHRAEALDPWTSSPSPRYRLARALVLEPLRRELGLERARHLAHSGEPLGAPARAALAAVDLAPLEIYAQVEASGPIALNAPLSAREGTVGRPLPGTEVRLADDGEVLLCGPHLAAGYFEDAASSGYLFEGGRWLKTGDVGELDEEGFLRVLGRKADLFYLSGGERVLPWALEERLRALEPVAHALVFGEGRPAPLALLALDAARAARFASARGLPADPAQLAAHPAFLSSLQRAVEEALARPPALPALGRFAVVPEALSLAAGSLTPLGTVRRRQVLQRHRALLDEPGTDPRGRRPARARH